MERPGLQLEREFGSRDRACIGRNFPTGNGVRTGSPDLAWLPAAAAAGVPSLGFHDLRCANATELRLGIDLKAA
ncbi:MAG: hypothetical protein M0004_15000 [Actinomycetota bacterium]|nr:hypothetical protein [Actinomycetota bacterium]